jgi:cytoskeletal protein CcmA (bactofilin family)
MLFNKRPDESFDHDTSPTLRSPASHLAEAAPSPLRKVGGAPTRSLIDAWLTITGNLLSEGEVQVDGQIKGDIRCKRLIVGKDAAIVGSIAAEEVVVRGKVEGVIRATRVILQDSAHVEGEIVHTRLAIEEGASFEGQARLCDEPTKGELIDLYAMAAEMRATIDGPAQSGKAAMAG